MKKRAITLVLLPAFMLALAAGCSGPADTRKAETTTEAVAGTPDESTGKSTEAAGGSDEPTRTNTLYVNGLIWGAPTNFNLLTSNSSFPVQGISAGFHNFLIYEALFMYNQLTGELEPLLGKSYNWDDDYTVRVEMNTEARWNDGQPLTAEDVAYTYMLGKKYTVGWSSAMEYMTEVTAETPSTVVIKLDKDKYNRLNVINALPTISILPKHIWQPLEEKADNRIEELRKEFNPDPVGSGPYKIMFYDDTRITLERDDNYWGKTLFGKLPAPKFITHIIYKSNDAGSNAFRNGEVDISQQFIPKVWDLWKDGAPFKTYLADFPYFIPGTAPMITFNMEKEGLNVPEVRRAIAMCIDYQKIGEVAMSGYTDPVEPGIVLNIESEKKYIDQEKVRSLMWTTDVDAANALLDSIGAKKGADGIRVLRDGTRLGPYELECPYGWSDWNAALEIVALSAKRIGIEMRTKFPEAPVWTNDRATGKFDIIMESGPSVNAAQPWDRARYMMKSEGVPPVGQTAYYNYGRFRNDRADELITLIPQQKDEARLKDMYTELNRIYLENIPNIMLMYRPAAFYTVSEKVWKGFPDENNNPGSIPPSTFSGAFIRLLYEITSTDS